MFRFNKNVTMVAIIECLIRPRLNNTLDENERAN